MFGRRLRTIQASQSTYRRFGVSVIGLMEEVAKYYVDASIYWVHLG